MGLEITQSRSFRTECGSKLHKAGDSEQNVAKNRIIESFKVKNECFNDEIKVSNSKVKV